MGFLDQILENFELLFWLLIVVGSSVATALKKRSQAQKEAAAPQRPPVIPSLPPLEDLLVEVEEELEADLQEELQEEELPSPTPMPVPPPRIAKEPEETVTAYLSKGELQLGKLQATVAATIQRHQAWRPTATWAEAILLREILGPPRSLSNGDLPALR